MSDNFLKIHKGLNLKPRNSDPLNPIEGDIQYSDGTVRPAGLWVYTNGAWTVAGGSGGGIDTFYSQDFEAYGVGDFTSGQNAIYRTAGTFDGVLSTESSVPIAGDYSPKYTAGSSSTNDWFDVEVVDLDLKQRNEYVGIVFYANMSNFSVDVDFVVWDITNGEALTVSGLDILVGGSGKQRYAFAVNIPETCNQISYGFHMVNAPVNTESFVFDDVEFSLNPFHYKEILNIEEWSTYNATIDSLDNPTDLDFRYRVVGDTLEVRGSGVAGASPSGGNVAFYIPSQFTIDTSKLRMGDNRNPLGIAQRINPGVRAKADAGNESVVFSDGTTTNKVFISREVYPSTTSITPSTGSGWVSGNDGFMVNFAVPIVGAAKKEHVITPSEGAITQTKFLTANVTTQSDMSDLTFTGLTIGHEYFISGQVRMESFDNHDTTVDFHSESGGLGTVYGSVSIQQGSGSLDRGTYQVSVFFKAESETLYVRKSDSNPKTIFGNNTRRQTFLQLTNKTRQFLAAVPVEQVVYIKDVKTSGSSGGNSSVNTVQTRDLNTVSGDSDMVSLSSNEFTLKSGKYDISASCPAFQVDQHQAFLYNVTDAVYTIDGSCEYSETGNMVGTNRSFIEGSLVLTKDTTFQIRHWTSDGVGSGLGVSTDTHASNPQSGEVYTIVKIRKLR